jgi:tetratricopeptide (TPR) repeat protein
MESFSHAHVVTLKRPEEYADRKPTVSLVLLAEGDLERTKRLLGVVSPHVDEIVVVTASADGTNSAEIDSLLSGYSLAGKSITHIEVNPLTHPELFMADLPATYKVSNPLCGEQFEGPFTGRSLITDWAKVRNLGWRRCSQEWKIFLDCCDELSNPSYIVSVCDLMENYQSDIGYALYVSKDGAMNIRASRIAKNLPNIEWVGRINPALEGGAQIAFLDGSLITTRHPFPDQAGRNLEAFKVLYARARWCNWQIPPGDLLWLARLSRYANLHSFAEAAIATYLDVSLYTEERAWACALQGELLEAKGDNEGASTWYERAIAEHPGYKSAYRLCRSRFKQQKWQACLDAFQIGLENDSFAHIVDDGSECKEKTLILVVAALQQLGRDSEAKENSDVLRRLYPNNQAILKLCDEIGAES